MQEKKIFPTDKRKLILQKLDKESNKNIPIVLYFHKQKRWKGLKQYMLVTIKPESSLHQFFKVVEAKLIWAGYLDQNNKSLYLYAKQRQLLVNDKKIQDIFQQYKAEDGWLQITLMSVNAFG